MEIRKDPKKLQILIALHKQGAYGRPIGVRYNRRTWGFPAREKHIKNLESMMKSIHKLLLAAGAMVSLGAPLAYADSEPNIWPTVPFGATIDYQSSVGLDGNIRVISLNYNATGSFLNASFSVLSPAGVQLASVATLPFPGFSVGNGTFPPAVLNPYFGFPANNFLVFGQADGNTTIVFLESDGLTPGHYVSFSEFTVKQNGSFVQATFAGPFAGTHIYNAHFDPKTGQLVVEWATTATLPATGFTNSAWTVNELGTITTFAGPFGPFQSTTLGHVDFDATTGNQVWFWDTFNAPSLTGNGTTDPGPGIAGLPHGTQPLFPVPSGAPHTFSIWGVNATGHIVTFVAFPPA